MAEVFTSFRTDDTPRVQALHDAFRARGLTVFWSNDIPKGAPNYQAIIKQEITNAPVVVVVWTQESVHSGPVIQECSHAERADKLFQVLLDEIDPIDMPMEVKYKAQKTLLIDWNGDAQHREWLKLNAAIDARLRRDGDAAASPRSVEIRVPSLAKVAPYNRDIIPDDAVLYWDKTVGEVVTLGEGVAFLETDYVSLAIECPASGILSKIHVPNGTRVREGAVVGVITSSGEDDEDATSD